MQFIPIINHVVLSYEQDKRVILEYFNLKKGLYKTVTYRTAENTVKELIGEAMELLFAELKVTPVEKLYYLDSGNKVLIYWEDLS